MTCDTYHVTHDMWQEVNKCTSCNGLEFMVFDDLGEKDHWLNQSVNQWINYGGVCRTAPATPVLLNIYLYIYKYIYILCISRTRIFSWACQKWWICLAILASLIVNRPGVDGVVLQTHLWLINWLMKTPLWKYLQQTFIPKL